MKHLAIALVVVAAAAVAWWLWPRESAPVRRDTAVATPAKSPAPTTAGSAEPRVRKLAPEERRELGDKIKAAIAKAHAASANNPGAGAGHAGNAPSLPEEPTLSLEQLSQPVVRALEDALPIVAECYKQYGTTKQAAAQMTMISDPELGTVVDTEAITDRGGKPIDAKLDECMRDTIDALALPPLGQPGKLKVQYTFRFDD